MESIGNSAESIAQAFIRAINRQDAERLAALMSPTHRFIDSLSKVIEGRDKMREGWAAYFRMVPDYYRDRIECHGSYSLRPNGADATMQHGECEIRVHYPVIGKLAERSIATGLKDHMAQEAAVLASWRP